MNETVDFVLYLSLLHQSLYFLHILLQLLVVFKQARDYLRSMKHGCVVSLSNHRTDARQRRVGVLLRKIHGNLTNLNHLLLSAWSLNLLRLDVVIRTYFRRVAI